MKGKEPSKGEQEKNKEAFQAMGSLRKLHNIVIYICGSPSRTKDFEDLA